MDQPVTKVGVAVEPRAGGTAMLSIRVVEIPEGEVMLAPMTQLELVRSTLEQNLLDDEKHLSDLQTRIGKKMRDAGAMMLQERGEWDVSRIDESLVGSALALLEQADRIGAEAQAIQAKAHGIFTNPLSRIKLRQLERDWGATEEKLAPFLIAIARQAPEATVAPANAAMAEVRELEQELAQLDASIAEKRQIREKVVDQLQKRSDTVSKAGFDLLLEAGTLAKNGLQPIASRLITKPGESAYLATHATLTKKRTRTHYVGRSSGVSFPIFKGVRYRVGSFRGTPITEEYVAYVGSGDLVLTNQRVAYVAPEHGASIPLDKLLHVEAYTDGLAFVKEGRESAYAFLVDEPNRFVYYLNYVLDHRASSPRAPKREPRSP